ncbi:MAG TPA: DHA2 family efflux MFS transporter permease subunit [Candidatus Binataceae bacterium]|jgi:DHA2 family multidrug resistance protein|nr:DHA2 family efflux MFS transporter permease subunit [Candidatus Binataceae bacterium]
MAEIRQNSSVRAPNPPAGDRGVRSPAKRLPPGQAGGRSPTPVAGEIGRPRHNPWAIALTVTMATFMEALDTSIANVALPHIAGSLAASVDESTWVLTSYLVSNAIVLPASAWLSTMFGRKRFYMSCVALFTISSLLCGLAPSLGMLIALRVLQGAGGGGLQPSEQAILADTFPPQRRGMAFAIYGMAIVVAPALGPTLGGWITDNYNWRWIFFINVPVGILSLILTQRMIQDPPHLLRERKLARRQGMRIDFIGLALLALTFGPLQVVLDKGEQDDWFHSHFIVAFATIALVAFVIGVIWEIFQKDPVVDLRLFKNRSFAASSILMFALGFLLYATTVLLPQFVQALLGYTAELAGTMLMPGGLALMLVMPTVGFLVARVDARWLIAFGFLALSASLYHMTGVDLEISWWNAMMLRVYQAGAIAFLFVPINTVSYAGMKTEQNNQVSALMNLMRNIGSSAGISLTGAMVTERAQFHQAQLVQSATSYSPNMQGSLQNLTNTLGTAGLSTPDALHQAYGRIYAGLQMQAQTLAYIDTFWVLALIALCLIPLVLFLRKVEPGKAPVAH